VNSRAIGAVAVTIGTMLLLSWCASMPYSAGGATHGALRLSWRMRGGRVEQCRPRTEAELNALPVHMRTPQVCEGYAVSYDLVVQIDDEAAHTLRLNPRGAKGDRPIFVLENFPVSSGRHRVQVRLSPIERSDHATEIRYEETLMFERGTIVLITLNEGGNRLERR
jgi:hypothetical protein